MKPTYFAWASSDGDNDTAIETVEVMAENREQARLIFAHNHDLNGALISDTPFTFTGYTILELLVREYLSHQNVYASLNKPMWWNTSEVNSIADLLALARTTASDPDFVRQNCYSRLNRLPDRSFGPSLPVLNHFIERLEDM